MRTRKLSCTVNGRPFEGEVAAGATLLELLRGPLHLTGAKEGCAKGECGACTVLVGGVPLTSCLTMALQAEGQEIVTIEGLADHWAHEHGGAPGPDALHPVQWAFLEAGAVQCGFCTPGLLMSAAALIEEIEAPTNDEIERGLEGNLCRCTGYTKVVEAVRNAADWSRAERARQAAEAGEGAS